MWKTIAENSALILGLAISAYTVYSFIETRITRKRQHYALIRSLRLESEYFMALALSLSHRAEQVIDTYAKRSEGESFPSPAAERDSLPQESQEAIEWLVSRAEHLLSYILPTDIEKLGSLLNEKQIEALLDFIKAYRVYTQVLATRTFDLKMFPRKKGVLHRFASVAFLNIEGMKRQLNAFGDSLGIGESISKESQVEQKDSQG